MSERDKTSLEVKTKTIETLEIKDLLGATEDPQTSNIEPPSRVIDTITPTMEKIQTTNETLILHGPEQNEQKAGHDNWITKEFMQKAQIRAFDPNWIPPCVRPESYNNDLEMASFMPSRYTWAGEQRKGMVCHITDSKDPVDHTRKAMGLEFFIAKEVPYPPR